MRALGTRHSFSRVADTDGTLLSTEQLDRIVEIGERTVTVEAGVRYGELGRTLDEHGLALPNYASLPHISVGGAVATATHGSGARNRSLAASVAALDLVRAGGELVHVERGDDDFDGFVVGLGTLGFVARVTLDVVPAFELRQYVFDGLPWATVEASLARPARARLQHQPLHPLGRRRHPPGLGEVGRPARYVLRGAGGGRTAPPDSRVRTRPTAPSSSVCRGRRASGCRTSASGSRRAAATSSSRSTRSRASRPSTRCERCARSGRS